jgi:hypothetical protein
MNAISAPGNALLWFIFIVGVASLSVSSVLFVLALYQWKGVVDNIRGDRSGVANLLGLLFVLAAPLLLTTEGKRYMRRFIIYATMSAVAIIPFFAAYFYLKPA